MNKKGIELALSTLILMILGVLVLIGFAYMLTNGFTRFGESTKPFLQTAEGVAVKEACNIACGAGDKLTYCCRNFTISSEQILCTDSMLEPDCSLTCVGFSCAR